MPAVAPPPPAPLTVICPTAKSRPPLHQAIHLLGERAEQDQRRDADRDAGRSERAATRRRPSSRTTAGTARMGGFA